LAGSSGCTLVVSWRTHPALDQHHGGLGEAGTDDQQHQGTERPGEQPPDRLVTAHRG
jgi:hypothetical protein